MKSTKDLDVVYIVKESEWNEELRHSIRSVAANLPHRRIVIVGYKPRWLQQVHHIPVRQNGASKHANSLENWMRACQTDGVSDDFVMMNDDFFIMEPMKGIPTLHREPFSEFVEFYQANHPTSNYTGLITRTGQMLEELQCDNPMCYELHVPMVMNKRQLLNVVRLQGVFNTSWLPINPRSLVGNFYRHGGKRVADVKVYDITDQFSKTSQFLSTTDHTFKYGKVGEHIRAKFTEKSKYES